MSTNNLFQCPICSNIPENEREAFLKSLNYQIRKYKKSERIANQSDEVAALFVLIKGSVKTEMIADSGAVLYIETINAPNPLAPAFLFAENNRFPVDVISLEDSEVMVIPKASVMFQLSINEAFLRSYMAFNANRTNFLSQRLKLIPMKTIKGKLSMYILQRCKDNKFVMDMNQTQLAEYFGVTRPSLARSLSEMIEDGIITLNKYEGKILNNDALKELIV
ncbi:MAG: Crp/Fnr family transcriptional regulator [Bacteroidales bacterium]|jgi:CRP-like cAMP-binding protein|nr:Crp/Fnr family transcriptional regulator [Bacteroidales bacterium]